VWLNHLADQGGRCDKTAFVIPSINGHSKQHCLRSGDFFRWYHERPSVDLLQFDFADQDIHIAALPAQRLYDPGRQIAHAQILGLRSLARQDGDRMTRYRRPNQLGKH
jgi:hypothetical protein